MDWTLPWLLALAALALVAVLVLRGIGTLAGGTHDLERLKAEAAGIHGRLDVIVEPLVAHLDRVRRGASDPGELLPEVDAARTALRTLAADARALQAPAPLADRVAQLRWELDRAVRAADMAGHGVRTLGTVRRRSQASGEAQVALKRGTLGLRHAREAVARLTAEIARLSPAEVRAMALPSRAGGVAGIPTPSIEEDCIDAGASVPDD